MPAPIEEVTMETQSTHDNTKKFLDTSQSTSSAKKAKAKKEKRVCKRAEKAVAKALKAAEKEQLAKAAAEAPVTSTPVKKPTRRMLGGYTIPKIVKTPTPTKEGESKSAVVSTSSMTTPVKKDIKVSDFMEAESGDKKATARIHSRVK